MRYGAGKREWVSSYPWLKDPQDLKNNMKVAVAKVKSLENRLERLGTEHREISKGD